MEEIGKDLYFNILKPALVLAIAIGALFVTNKFLGDDIREVIELFAKEIRAVLNRDRNMKSLNAVVVITTAIGLAIFGLAFGPQPEDALFAFGKGTMWAFLLIFASLFCVYLVRSDRDQ